MAESVESSRRSKRGQIGYEPNLRWQWQRDEEVERGFSRLQSFVQMGKISQGSVQIMETERIISEVKKLAASLEEREKAANELLKETVETSQETRKFFETGAQNLRQQMKEDTLKVLDLQLKRRIEPAIHSIRDDITSVKAGISGLHANYNSLNNAVNGIHLQIGRYGPWNLATNILTLLGIAGVIWAILKVGFKVVP
jgi:chromosome segregation ATPase